MSRAVMISIRPEWCDRILFGQKTIELRKKRPKLETPFKCYIYMTAGDYQQRTDPWLTAVFTPEGKVNDGSRKVIGEFTCRKIESFVRQGFDGSREKARYILPKDVLEDSCLSYEQIEEYAKGRELFAWHISHLKIYEEPKPLHAFHNCLRCGYMGTCEGKCWNGLTRPPQSWCYVDEVTT